MAKAIRTYLDFFADHPEYVELLIQERAQFKDREKPTFFQHREVNVERWRALYRSLIGQGRVRPMSVERITDVIGDLLYGTILTNLLTSRPADPDAQAADVLDVILNGLLTTREEK